MSISKLPYYKYRSFAIINNEIKFKESSDMDMKQWLKEEYDIDDKKFEKICRGFLFEYGVYFFIGENDYPIDEIHMDHIEALNKEYYKWYGKDAPDFYNGIHIYADQVFDSIEILGSCEKIKEYYPRFNKTIYFKFGRDTLTYTRALEDESAEKHSYIAEFEVDNVEMVEVVHDIYSPHLCFTALLKKYYKHNKFILRRIREYKEDLPEVQDENKTTNHTGVANKHKPEVVTITELERCPECGSVESSNFCPTCKATNADICKNSLYSLPDNKFICKVRQCNSCKTIFRLR